MFWLNLVDMFEQNFAQENFISEAQWLLATKNKRDCREADALKSSVTSIASPIIKLPITHK